MGNDTLFTHKIIIFYIIFVYNICLHYLFTFFTGKEEALISCYGCGNSVHPSCRVYSADLVQHFQKEGKQTADILLNIFSENFVKLISQHFFFFFTGWTCDDCKTCIVCSESQTNVSVVFCKKYFCCLHVKSLFVYIVCLHF